MSRGAPDGLLYICDTLSCRLFLVDTGAMISGFPHRSPVSAATSLRAAVDQPIPSWGKRTLPLSFLRDPPVRLELQVAAVDRPILGADFLQHHQFDVIIARHLLISVDGEVELPLLPSSSPSTLLSKVSVEYQEVLAEFPEIVGLGFALGQLSMMSTIMW